MMRIQFVILMRKGRNTVSEYKFSLIIKKKGFSNPKIYEKTLEFDYNDKSFLRIEQTIKNTVVKLSNQFIDEEFYK